MNDDFETVRVALAATAYESWAPEEQRPDQRIALAALDRIEAEMEKLRALNAADRESYTRTLKERNDEVERLRAALREISGQILLGDCLDIAVAALAKEKE
jgi:esterase/lipase superfamily enzyme